MNSGKGHKAVGVDETFRIVCYLANQIEEWRLYYEKVQYFMYYVAGN